VTADQLRKAEAAFKKSYAAAERDREGRNEAVLEALRTGWTHQQISDATGLSRGRISQIARHGLKAA
jgi:DNA-binding NarL/FixJ family response regulator